jgi:hypothetical protein
MIGHAYLLPFPRVYETSVRRKMTKINSGTWKMLVSEAICRCVAGVVGPPGVDEVSRGAHLPQSTAYITQIIFMFYFKAITM